MGVGRRRWGWVGRGGGGEEKKEVDLRFKMNVVNNVTG